MSRISRILGFAACTTPPIAVLLLVIGMLLACHYDVQNRANGDDAVILVREGAVLAQWNYQQLPMRECRWCGRTVNLNRHHVVPQAANPALRDVRENLVVLCRDCHFVLGHRCDWKRYNPDVLYIATHFTNCVRSADTRYWITNAVRDVYAPAKPEVPDTRGILHVTNDVPPQQRSALENILKWSQESLYR